MTKPQVTIPLDIADVHVLGTGIIHKGEGIITVSYGYAPAHLQSRERRICPPAFMTKPGRDDVLIELEKKAPHGALAPLVREAMRNGSRSTDEENQSVEEDFDLPDLTLNL